MARPPRGRTAATHIASLTVALLIMMTASVGGGLVWAWHLQVAAPLPPGAVSTVDLDGNHVVWYPSESGQPIAGIRPTGGRLQALRLSLDVPLLEASTANGWFTPPTFTDAYLVRDYGDPRLPSTGLAVVAMHSVRGGRGPGNALFDPGTTNQPKIRSGDRVMVDGVDYIVTARRILTKKAASVDQRTWRNWKQRGDELVIITCLLTQNTSAQNLANLVVYARRA